MKKLKLNLQQFDGAEVLTRNQLKKVLGGGGGGGTGSGGPCDDCTKLCHRDDNGDYGYGMCSPETGGTSCHNYCCADPSNTYWC